MKSNKGTSMISMTVVISISTRVTSLQPYHLENGH